MVPGQPEQRVRPGHQAPVAKQATQERLDLPEQQGQQDQLEVPGLQEQLVQVEVLEQLVPVDLREQRVIRVEPARQGTQVSLGQQGPPEQRVSLGQQVLEVL